MQRKKLPFFLHWGLEGKKNLVMLCQSATVGQETQGQVTPAVMRV